MKGKTLSAVGIIIAAIGVALLIFHQSISSKGVVVTGGILFILAGLPNLIFFDQLNNGVSGASRVLSHVANAAAIILGICLLVFQSTFIPLVPFIFGLLVAIAAIWQFFLLALGTRPYQLPGWLYLFPLAITGGAVYIFLQQQSRVTDYRVMLVTGTSAALLGLACIAEGWALGLARRRKIRRDKEETPAVSPAIAAPHPEAAPLQSSIPESAPHINEHQEKDSLVNRAAKSAPETTENLDDPSEIKEK